MGIFHRSHHLVALPLTALLLQVFFLPNIIQAAPASGVQDKCQLFCRPGSSSVLSYEAGEYLYDFSSNVTTEVTLASPEERRTKVRAKVVVVGISPCEFTLKVNNLQVNNDGGDRFEKLDNLNAFTGRFTLQDGIIGNICLDENEPTFSANIKRAIISLLQNKALEGVSENEVVESDISGRCPTKYSIDGDDYVKTKKLNACLHREGGRSILRGVPYEVNSNFNSVPDLASEQTCTQTLENGIYKRVECTELHKIEKFLKKSDGPNLQTRVSTTLTFISTKKGTSRIRPNPNAAKTSIYYDYSDHTDAAGSVLAAQSARVTLEKICNEGIRPDGVTSEVPQFLLDLKKSLARSDKASLTALYTEIKSGSFCATGTKEGGQNVLLALFLDTAAQSAGDGAFGLLAELYQRDELSRVTKRYFYLYATLANHPHVESLQAVLPLISDSTREVAKKLLLAVSGLAHQYCKTSNPNCGKRAEYNAIVDRIAAIVEENAASTDGSKQEIAVAALQALGNLDHLTPSAVAAIQLALVTGNDRIQVRALDAFRRDPCEAKLKKDAQAVFTNVDNHANLRIGAYLANLRCLESGDAAVIQAVLNDEQSLQVGGFIQSHLTNLLKSSSPSTRSLKSSARQLSLKLQYPKELRKFSRHLESSLFNADLNLGYSAEGSVIFSKESFIPRQLSANLTFDIFGQSYNLVEVGLYLENFDHLQETVFGPHGKFPFDEKVTTHGLLNKILKLRNKRETVGPVVLDREGLQAIERQVESNTHSLVETDHSTEAGIGDLYIRLFGTTVSLISLNTKEAPQTLSELKDKVRVLVGDAIRTSKKEIHFIHPVLINEDEVIVPTTSGFGLSSSLEANVVPSLDYSKDYKAPDGNGSPLDLKLKLGSNLAGSLRGRLSLVGGPIETGIQLEANLRTGGAVEIVLFKDANKFEARLNLPNDRVRAFDLNTNVVWIKRGPNRAESKSNFRNSLHVMPGNPNSCEEAFPPLRIIGLKLCYRSTINTDENTPFLLNGRQSFAASLEKTESSMEGYAILFTKTNDGNNRNFDLSFDTPGSGQNRKLSLIGHVVDDEAAGKKKITVELQTPNHSDVTLEYERTNTANLKGILAKVTLPSGTLQVDGHIQKTATGQDELTYEPHLSIEYPGSHADRPIRRTFITGKVVRVPGKKLTVALSNQLPEIGYDVAPLDLFLKGSVEVSGSGSEKHYELKGIELGVRNRDQDQGEPNPVLTINGDLNRKEGEVSTDLEVKYGPTLDYQISVHKTCKSSPGKVDLKTKVILSQFPVLNFDLSVHAEKGEGTYNSLNSVKLGPEGRQIQFSTQTNAVVTDKTHFDVSNKLSFAFQPRSFESTLETHVKNFAGEEQVVAVKVLSSDGQGERTKVTLNFDRKAAQNNDFTLTVAVKAKRGQIQGQLTHVRTALNDATHQSEGYTHSFKHETTFSSQSLSISEDKLVTYIRILNREDAKGASVKSEFTNDNGATVNFEAIAKSLATEIVTDLRLKYKGDELASLEIKGLKDLSNLVLNTYLTNQWRIHAQREYKDANHCVTNVNAEILSTGRTVTLDVDRSKTGDNTRVVAEAKWDAARDASQSIKLVSDNQIVFGSIHVTSKNQLTVVGQNVELNLEANVPSDISQGEHSASLQYIAPESRSYEIKYSNALAIDPAHRSSNAKVNINIPEIRPTEISWKVESLNPNLKQLVFDISAEVALSFGGVNVQNMLAKLSASNNVQNGERSVAAKLALGGESIPENILVDSKLVLGPHSLKTENSIQIGTTISGIEIAGDLNDENDVRIGNLKYTLTNLPLSKYQKIEGELQHKRLLSGPLKIQRTHEIKLDGRTALKYNYAFALLNGKLSAETQVTSWDRQLLDANVNGVSDEVQVDLSGHITVNSQNVDVKLHVDRVNPLNLLQIRAETNEDGFSLKLQNTKTSPPTYALNTNVKFQGNVVTLEGELVSSSNERGLSLKYTRGQGVSREFKGHYVKDGDLLTFDGLVSLSAGQSVTVDGSATKVAGGYEGQVNYQLQSSNANNGVVKFTVVIQDTRRKLSFLAGDATAPTDFLSLDYTKAETSDKIHYAGSFSTDLFHVTFEEPKLKGTFTADCHHGHGHGNEITATINYEAEEVAQGVIQAELKLVTGELRTFLSVTDTLHSRSFSEELHVKKGAEGENPRQNKFRWVYKSNNGDVKTYGITFDSEKNSVQKSLDATLKFIFGNEDSDVLGVHVYGKLGKKGGRGDGGLDINLPSRQISATVVTKATGTGGELNVWLDKKRNPNQKLTLTVEYEKKQTSDGAKGYKYTATLKHPALAKPLTVHREVVRFGDLIVHESLTELDLLDDPNNKIRIEARAAWNDNTHSQLTTKLSVKSEGLGLLLEGEGEVTKQANSIVANLHYSFKNRNGELNQRNVELVYSDNHQSILVGEKSDPVLLLSRSVRDLGEHRRRRSVATGNSNTVDVRYEVHLPGMRDTRVIDIHLHGSVPPHLNLKTFTTGSDRQDKTYEINLGFPNERQLILGFYRQLAHQKTNLAEFSVALNTTRLLSVKARWDLETLQQVLKTATERFESTGDNLQSTSEVYINEVAQDLQHVLQKLSEALPNLSPLQQRLRGELEEIKSEWAKHPTTQQLRQLVDIVISTLEAASEPIQNLLEVLNDFPAYLNQLKAKSPALVKKYEKLVRSLKIQLGKLLKVALQTGRPIILEIQKLIQRIKSRVDGELKTGAENALGRVRTIGDSVYAKVVEYFLDHADDIGHYLEHSSASPEVKEFGVKILRYAVAKLKGQEQEAQAIREQIAQKGRAAIEKLVGELLTVDIKNGVISAIIPLPRPVNSLLDVRNAVRTAFPQIKLSIPYRNRLTSRLNILKQFVKELYSTNLLTAVSKAFRTNAPPHSAQAYIIGSQYFITFDGKLFHHEGHCQYLLLSDFIHKDLTVAIDFENQNGEIKKSIIVADKDETVVIHPDFSVTSEGRTHIEITETAHEVKLVVEDHEATITCNKDSDVCTVSIDNGYLFGHVAGLLGTYNNEQYDDLRTPAGEPTPDTDAFAASWKLNGACTEPTIPNHPPVSSEASKLCSYAFTSRWSPLRSCFGISDAAEYETICKNLSAENGWTVKEAVCTAANAYEQTCGGVNYNHLDFCSH